MHRLRIILEVAARGLQSGFKTAGAAVKNFFSSLRSMAKSGRKFIDGLAKSVFFLGHAFDRISGAVRSVYDRFIGTAGSAAKLEVRLKSITGSSADAARIMSYLEQVARDTGASFENLGEAAVLVATMAKDASGKFDPAKFERLNDMLLAMAAFTGPRVPIERLARGLAQFVTTGNVTSLEMFLDVLLGTKKAAEDVTDIPGEIGKAATFITMAAGDAAEDAAGDLDWLASQLDRLGIGIGLVQDVAELSGMERFNETLQAIARTLGEPLFEALNEGLSELADWLQENPELLEEFAAALGKLGAEGIENIFEALMKLVTSGQLEKFIEGLTEFLDKLVAGDLEGAFEVMGLGELGDDLKDAVSSLGDIADALGIVADWILAISGRGKREDGEAAKTGEEVQADVAAKAKEDTEKVLGAWAGILDNIELIAEKLLEPVGMAAPVEPQQVELKITLDNQLLDAQIVQGAEGVTVRAFDQVHQNYRNRER